MKYTVLVVEDHETAGETLLELLNELGYRGQHVTSAEKAAEVLENSDVDIVLADLNLPGEDGLWLLDRVQEHYSSCPYIVITGNATVGTAVQAIKKGAYDYLEKPLELDKLDGVLTGAARLRRLVLQNEVLTAKNQSDDPFQSMIGSSPKIAQLKKVIERVGPTQASVLILGESGTGKELVANALVALSERSRGPYIKLNSAALPRDMLESELFGHVRGAFTGAVKDRKGRFELAHQGSLFMDEIGDMPLETQVKLLRVLQEGEFERLGSTETIKVDVRIIAATNCDLWEKVQKGTFREDLYYRLNVIQLEVPPLRERPDDITALATHYLKVYASKEQKQFSDKALQALKQYGWPGNVRELKNIMERLAIIVPGEHIEISDLPREVAGRASSSGSGVALQGTMDDIEREAIFQALRDSKGVKSEAASKLAIGLKTLYRKLDKYQEEGYDLSFIKESGGSR